MPQAQRPPHESAAAFCMCVLRERTLAVKIHGMKTVVYVDGFNLYYRALKKTSHRWLNLSALCEAALPRACDIAAIHYYTARISGRHDPSSPKDQNSYLKALQTLPNLQVHLGSFQVTNKWMFLVQPVAFRPANVTPPIPNPGFACVVRTEEKGPDVSLGAHMVRDAFIGVFEQAAVITDDTDLTEPVRIVVEEAKLPITLLTPVDRPAGELKRLATHIRNIRPYLGASQFSNPVIGPKGPIAKPAGW